MKYRKKPVVIDAIQWTGKNFQEIEKLLELGDGKRSISYGNQVDYLEIHTLEGTMKANKGDFVIKGVSGELYPCKPDIFEKTYEKFSLDNKVK
ncbi:MAG: hypothetical protein WC803_12725 [Sphingomonas sp.]|jgi:hypothetical protein